MSDRRKATVTAGDTMLSEQEKLEHIATLGINLHQIKDLDILMQTILTEARDFVNADAGSIYVREDDNLNFTYTQNDTLSRRLPEGEKLIYSTFTMPINERSISGYVAATGMPLDLPDVYSIDPSAPYRFNKNFDNENRYITRSVLTLPLTNPAGDVMGVLQVINPQDQNKQIVPFSEWDGNGYPGFVDVATGLPIPEYAGKDGTPRGKKGEEIPIFGRIVALADVYDALSSARVYKEAWKEADVLSTIKKESGAQFDPTLITIFFSCLDDLRSIQNRYVD